ncbi:hypothetical protein NLM16_01300 [Bradyrhizobium brasilense]|uniref:hypothetical protein n=1 Tax=Bradyrhizobium brasilense TaxID=1419277 RepID=UPI002878019A|nr:hypothetical protein [Bradyrhizobium brasilense]MCP3412731.1 hypothetical protein [Bradyrhizobium brasilense]
MNGNGTSGNYNIWRFDRFGFANPSNAVIGPVAGNAGSGITLVAQPSPVKLSDRTRVFAMRFNGTIWTDIAYWDSFDGGVTFGTPTSIITAASLSASNGIIGPALYVVPVDATPFKMLLGIRSANSVPTGLRLATSTDCSSWTVQPGNVFTQGADAWQAGGIVPSSVYRRPNGNWVVTLNTYNASLAQAYGAYAEATSPSGPFGAATLIASPYTAQVGTLTGTAGQNTGTSSITVRLNEPYMVFKSGDQAASIVTPIAQSGSTVTFDLPLPATYSGAEFAHLAANAIDPSIIVENGDGTCTGIFTVYKAFSDVLGEYTVTMSAPSLSGPWTISSGKVFFQPTGIGNQHINSTENPSPIIDASSIV